MRYWLHNHRIGAIMLSLTTLGGCVTAYTPETAETLRNGVGVGTLCGELNAARDLNQYDTVEILVKEYKRRHPNTSKQHLSDLRTGKVRTGMPSKVARCSWNATKVGATIGYGQHQIQYQSDMGGSYSYFFVNGNTDRVEYIATL